MAELVNFRIETGNRVVGDVIDNESANKKLFVGLQCLVCACSVANGSQNLF